MTSTLSSAWTDYFNAIADHESSDNYTAVNSYGYLGRYQLGESALTWIGYVGSDSNPNNNDYSGGWTGKDGITTQSSFIANHDEQDLAMAAYTAKNWNAIKYYHLDQYIGDTINGQLITASGELAGAHLVGIGNLKTYLESDGATDPVDGNGTHISTYIADMAGLDIPLRGVPDQHPSATPVQDWVNDAVEAPFAVAESQGSPLVLDLGTSGISLSSASGTGSVYWDLTQDGMKNASGWISGNTALLAIDLNNDGLINNNGELFGNSATYANGFAALASYDTNHDGHISSADTQFADLLVWTDDNHDGVSQGAELHTLSSLSITDINLSYSSSSTVINGNTLHETSSFTMGGVSHAIADAWFNYDAINTVYDGSYTLDPNTFYLPNQRGYGMLPDLNIAMSNDNSGTGNLEGLVTDVSAKSLSQLLASSYDLQGALTDIAYRWASVDGISPTSRGSYVDAQELGFLEKILGQDYLQLGTYTDPPGALPEPFIHTAFEAALGTIGGNILVQAGLGELFDNPLYDVASDSLSNSSIAAGLTLAFDTPSASDNIYATGLNEVFLFHPGDSPTSSSGGDYIYETSSTGTDTILIGGGVAPSDTRLWDDGSGKIFIQYSSTDKITVYSGNYLSNVAFDDGTVWHLLNGLHISDTNDDHTLYGTALNDSIEGRGGSDYMYGGAGNDTYVFSAGDSPVSGGGDHITEYSGEGTDTILLHGITASAVRTWDDSAGHLFIQYTSTDKITVDGSASGGVVTPLVEHIVFDDSTDWNLTTGLKLTDTDDSHALYGSALADVLDGRGGDDSITGNDGNDTIIGGTGSDYLYGGTGNDTYVFSPGDSQVSVGGDHVTEYSGEGTDTILIHSVTPSDVRTWDDSGGHLYIQYTSTDKITVDGSASGGVVTPLVEHIVFDDSTDWNLTTGLKLTDTDDSHALYGSASADVLDGRGGDDSIEGFGGNDVLIGGAGSNYLTGDAGADTFKFVSATASDTVTDFTVADGDKLDVSQLLDGYDPVTSAIADFVKITESSGNSTLSVNVHGTGVSTDYHSIATLSGVTGITNVADDLTNHILVAA